jgi:hypothetical protein
MPSFIDHLVCPQQYVRRDRDPDLLGGFEIDHQLKSPTGILSAGFSSAAAPELESYEQRAERIEPV